jgi:hypothetical protein
MNRTRWLLERWELIWSAEGVLDTRTSRNWDVGFQNLALGTSLLSLAESAFRTYLGTSYAAVGDANSYCVDSKTFEWKDTFRSQRRVGRGGVSGRGYSTDQMTMHPGYGAMGERD